MSVQTNEHAPVTPSCHEHGSEAGDAPGAHTMHAPGRRANGSALTAVLALPRPVRNIGGAGVVVGGLIAVGVPAATLTPLLFLGGCLSMHLFMGHGQHGTSGGAAGTGTAEGTSPRRDG